MTAGMFFIIAFWCLFGSAFLSGTTLYRYYVITVLWQLYTPTWPFWLDTVFFLTSFTAFEMAYRALRLSVRKRDTAPAPAPVMRRIDETPVATPVPAALAAEPATA